MFRISRRAKCKWENTQLARGNDTFIEMIVGPNRRAEQVD